MSAAPLPVLALAGTSEGPLRVAFSFSAKAGAAKATVAPSASVASMVLVFSMVFSLWRRVAPVSKQRDIGFISATTSPWRCSGWRCRFRYLWVADRCAGHVGGHHAGLHARPGQRTDNLQRR